MSPFEQRTPLYWRFPVQRLIGFIILNLMSVEQGNRWSRLGARLELEQMEEDEYHSGGISDFAYSYPMRLNLFIDLDNYLDRTEQISKAFGMYHVSKFCNGNSDIYLHICSFMAYPWPSCRYLYPQLDIHEDIRFGNYMLKHVEVQERVIDAKRWRYDRFMDEVEKLSTDNLPLSPQAFNEAYDSMHEVVEKLRGVNTVPIPERFWYHTEGISILAAGLMTCHSVPSGIAHICAYARSLSGESVASMIKTYLSELSWNVQAGEEEDWLSTLKLARTNWKMALNNVHFENMRNVLTVMVSLGLCESSRVSFNIGGMNMFSIKACKEQKSAIDLIDAVLSTVVSFIEGGYECFKQGSAKPLLYGDTEMSMLEDQCVRCERLFEFAKTGDVHNAEEGMTEAAYFKLLIDTIDKLKELKITAKGGMVQKMITMKLEKLQKQKVQYERCCNKSGLRVAPWSFLIYGGSGVGKSSVSNILMIASLKQNGFPSGDTYLVTNNEHDKYDSSLKSYVTGIFFDDMCNTKLEFLQTAPAANIIQTVNNVRAYGNMAEADEKGKVLKEPKVVSTTTNVKNLNSTAQSECPLSIERRNAYILTVTVKSRFAKESGMLDQEKVYNYYVKECGLPSIPVVPDLWNFTVENAVGAPNPTPGRPDIVVYVPVVYKGKTLVDIDMRTLLEYNRDASKIHFKNQKMLVDNQTNLSDKMDWCNTCAMPGSMCMCTVCTPSQEDLPVQDDTISFGSFSNEECKEYQGQFGGLIAKFAVETFVAKKVIAKDYWEKTNNIVEAATLELMQNRLKWLEQSPYAQWTNWIPSTWLDNEHVRNAILCTHASELKKAIVTRYVMYVGLIVFSLLSIWTYTALSVRLIFILILCWAITRLGCVIETEKTRLYVKIADANGSMEAIFKEYREASVCYITNGCLLIGTFYALACIWKHLRVLNMEPQGNIAPTSIAEIEERDAEAELEKVIAKEQNWCNVYVAPIPSSEVSKTITPTQLVDKVFKNQTQFTWEDKDGKHYGCDLFFIESNIAIAPQHIWKHDEMKVTISRGTSKIQRFNAIISKVHSIFIPNTDLCLVYIPNAGSWANLCDYLPISHIEAGRKLPTHFIYKEMRGSKPERLTCDTILMYEDQITCAGRDYPGAKYELSFKTFSGLCMGTFVTNMKETMLAGFHTAGVGGTCQGAMCTLLRSQYEEARKLLSKKSGVLLCASEGTLQTQMYGKPVITELKIHEKSPLKDLPDDAHLDIYGTCPGRATYKSSVMETPIADTVCKVCDVEKTYDKPKFKTGKPWEKSINVSCKPSIGVEPSLLAKAVDDYKDHLIEKIDSIPELKTRIRPLSKMENLCGMDGVRFIDKINPHTAVGFPLSGQKSKYIKPLEPKDYPGFANPTELDEQFWEEVERMEKEYLAGKRCHVIFKACLKDEPTKKTKDKVRVFQAAPIALQLLVRKYFLPIVRLLSLFPLDSECGVGINTMGPEFDSLIKHMRSFGADRILAGDYSKYDLRMAAQFVLAAFNLLIAIAEYYDYSQDSLVIMRGIATDIAYPVMAYNGDLLQHIGTNPSGQNLTVYINSIVNSLLLRSAYFHMYGLDAPKFRSIAAMMTYGDDVKGSVKKGYDEFNHISYTKFLADRDMVFTMPDKESTPTKYMNDCDADFLKRKNYYNEELNQWMGALSEDSIFKSLTSILKSGSITPIEQSMQNIDGALREWFMYGRDHYELRRGQMKEIAKAHSIEAGCSMLDVSYEKCLQMYRERYGLGQS